LRVHVLRKPWSRVHVLRMQLSKVHVLLKPFLRVYILLWHNCFIVYRLTDAILSINKVTHLYIHFFFSSFSVLWTSHYLHTPPLPSYLQHLGSWPNDKLSPFLEGLQTYKDYIILYKTVRLLLKHFINMVKFFVCFKLCYDSNKTGSLWSDGEKRAVSQSVKERTWLFSVLNSKERGITL
jgi:hypothetical protein